MANATSSSSKRRGSKAGDPGGRGSTGGDTGGRGARARSSIPLSADMLRLTAPDLARAVKQQADERATAATPYRTAMSSIASYANAHSKAMLPELRVKLAKAKDELRVLYDMPHDGKGTGGPGAKRAKPKAQSRRNDRHAKGSAAARGGTYRTGGR